MYSLETFKMSSPSLFTLGLTMVPPLAATFWWWRRRYGVSERTIDEDPLLSTNNPDRLSLFPLSPRTKWAWDMYKQTQRMVWFTEEIDLATDILHFQQMTPDERVFIETIFAFFAQADSIVNETVVNRLYGTVQDAAVRAFYGLQIAVENVHSETYNVIIDTLVTDRLRRDVLFRAVETMPAVRKKADFAMNYMKSDDPFAEQLVAFACVEGIQFSSSFCAIFWLKQRNLLPGVTFSNELISRDEAMHCMFSVRLYHTLQHKLSVERLHTIIREAVEVERVFVDEALRCPLIGMNSTSMKQYVEFVGDYICGLFEVPKLYNVTNPFPFMEAISLHGKTNFFEKRVSEYQKQTTGRDISVDDFTSDQF